ncbi:Uncharacterised protein [Mycobacteroides abscessus subsp. abscessus]|nr:Uncharacterised protein [Mycobacteroides abscessus subsp. abscessus]SKV36729.1 Uncharacterised protein [Mycobacteroides abscessus subsp. abscessus]
MVATRHASMFSAPVPCSSTFAATVPANGLRATTMGSNEGLSAVPQPCHCLASPVAGAVASYSARNFPSVTVWDDATPFVWAITSRSAPAALSMALDTSSDFGNPEPYSQAMLSRISKPASSIAAASRCQVRDPPNASRWPPGLRMRRHSVAQAVHQR